MKKEPSIAERIENLHNTIQEYGNEMYKCEQMEAGKLLSGITSELHSLLEAYAKEQRESDIELIEQERDKLPHGSPENGRLRRIIASIRNAPSPTEKQ